MCRYRNAFKETLCCWGKRESRKYRDHSSFRETTVHHTSDGTNLVRIRSQHERRKRVDFRRNSYDVTETTTLCGEKRQDYYKNNKRYIDKNIFNEISDSNYNNNEFAKLNDVNDKCVDIKDIIIHNDVNGDALHTENDININISIHLHPN